MTRRDLLALVVAALVVAMPGASALAKGGEGDPKKPPPAKPEPKKKPVKPKETVQSKLIKEIAADFKKRDAAALVARIKPKGSLKIDFKDARTKNGDYKQKQAAKVLKAWFN